VDEVFRALADPNRRRLLDSLRARNGQTLTELCGALDIARQSVSKHLAILEAANIVTTVRRGREKLHYLNPIPINDIAERWINRYDQPRVTALADLREALEMTTTTRPAFVYTTYIRTTPERLWQALTDPAFTRRYWGVAWESDWQPGSPIVLEHTDRHVRIEDPEQVVIAAEPHRRLSYTWHTFTPEWAAAYGRETDLERLAAEPRSTVTYELEPEGDQVRLTVVHEGFGPDSLVLESISQGWPRVLSALKTLLEAG
jgi:uncharacterized protein YndB with AHSA1/START domain/DNA-binding transcriptional ArsR family regulator